MTGKQRAFITAYIAGGMTNASAAYRLAYNVKPETSQNVVGKNANRLLQNANVAPFIKSAIEKAEQERAREAAQYVVTKDRISHALACMAFADPRSFYEWQAGTGEVSLKPSTDLTDNQAAAVQSVSSAVTKYGRTIKVELADRRGALMDLAKLHGHVVERKDVRVIKSLDDLTEDELRVLAGPDIAPPAAPADATKH